MFSLRSRAFVIILFFENDFVQKYGNLNRNWWEAIVGDVNSTVEGVISRSTQAFWDGNIDVVTYSSISENNSS